MGLYSAAVLAALEDEFGPTADRFDLIAGTSIGGIIALGLSHRTPAAAIRDAFLENGQRIFSGRPAPRGSAAKLLGLTANAMTAKYDPEPLRGVIEDIVGAQTLIGDLLHRTMVPAVNLTKGSPQVFKTPHHPTFKRDLKLKVVDVAMATSAAPTFFPMHRIGGELFADGGMYANAPDHLALHEAEHFLEQTCRDISVLSIGTTTSRFSFSNSIDPNLGWMGWMEDQRLPNVMIASQQANVDFMMRHRLGDRYTRIDREQSKEQERSLALDVANPAAKTDLLALAEASVREHLGQPALARLFAHTPAKPTFFNRED